MAEGTVWMGDDPGLGVCSVAGELRNFYLIQSLPSGTKLGFGPRILLHWPFSVTTPMASVLRSLEKSATSSLGIRECKVMLDSKLATARLSITDQECFPSLFRTLPSLEEGLVSTEAVRRDLGS